MTRKWPCVYIGEQQQKNLAQVAITLFQVWNSISIPNFTVLKRELGIKILHSRTQTKKGLFCQLCWGTTQISPSLFTVKWFIQFVSFLNLKIVLIDRNWIKTPILVYQSNKSNSGKFVLNWEIHREGAAERQRRLWLTRPN